MKIYVLRDKQEQGPFELSQIFAGLTNGRFSPNDQARKEGETEWRRLDDLLKDGSSLFSVGQIRQMQSEQAPESVVVPDLQPLRPIDNNAAERPRRGLSPVPVAVFVLAAMLAIVLIHGWAGRSTDDVSSSTVVMAKRTPAATPPPAPSVVPTAPQEKRVASAPTPSPEMANPLPTGGPSTPQPSPPTIAAVALVSPSPTASPEQPPEELALSKAVDPQSQPLSSFPPSPSPQKTTPNVVSAQPTPESTTPAQNIPQASFVVSNTIPTPPPTPSVQAFAISDFFKINSVQFLKKEPKSKIGVWHIENSKKRTPPEFRQCLEVKVSARENTRSDQMIARAYFYDDRYKKIGSLDKPSPSGKPRGKLFSMPVLFYKDKPDSIFFEVPKGANSNWKAVVICGDIHELHASCYPPSETDFMMDYPEKKRVHDAKKLVARKPAMDPLIQYEVKTKNPRQPKITLFLRPPKGISSADDVTGVLCLCILANSIDNIKRELQKEEMSGDYNGLLGFANTHKLAILAWGSTGLWNPGANFEDLPKAQAKAMDKSFDLVADAWEKGVHELGDKYGIPQKDFLLWGACGSAQWAHRLCLRKPDYFLAIDIHIPGSFDKPTPGAAKVLWCLTTGERYGGYDRSLRFVAACKKLGYPIVYKAIVGLGHSGHPDATAMGFRFFEFALTQKTLRDEYDKKLANAFGGTTKVGSDTQPWPEAFREPPYFGDIVNQEMFPANQVTMIPVGFRTPLPTKAIADIWARSH